MKRLMTTNWNEFLHSCGARRADGYTTDFGDLQGELAAAKQGLVLADLSHWGLIGFSGEDAQTFLHGQVTNDLRTLKPERAAFAGYCSAKGRMLANFLVFRRGDELLVMLPEALRETIQKRLAMFILRAKVKARDAGGEWVRIGLSGPGAEALLTATLGIMPASDIMAVAHADNAFAVRLGSDRFDIFVAPADASEVWEQLAASARPVGAGAWDWLMVDSGIPTVMPETQDQFVPQMANLDLTGAVNFKKGCYPGQEIVARMQYLGRLKQRMYLAHVEGAAAQAGDLLYSADMEGQHSGTVMNAAPAPGGGHDLLAVVQIGSREHQTVHLGSLQGAKLEFLALPYAIP